MILIVDKIRDFDRSEVALHYQLGDFISDREHLNHRLPAGISRPVAVYAAGTGPEGRVAGEDGRQSQLIEHRPSVQNRILAVLSEHLHQPHANLRTTPIYPL